MQLFQSKSNNHMDIDGIFTIKPVTAFIILKPKARLLADNIKAIAKFTFGGQELETKKSLINGINPSWEETFTIQKSSSDTPNTLNVKLIDKRTLLPDQLIGELSIDISRVITSKCKTIYEMWMCTENKVTAKIQFEVMFKQQFKYQMFPQGVEDFQQQEAQDLFIPSTAQNLGPQLIAGAKQETQYTIHVKKAEHTQQKQEEKIQPQLIQTDERLRRKIKKMLAQRNLNTSNGNQSQLKPSENFINGYKPQYVPPETEEQEDQSQDLSFYYSSKISISDLILIHSEELGKMNTLKSTVKVIENIPLEQTQETFNGQKVEKGEVKEEMNEPEIIAVDLQKVYTPAEMDEILQ